MSKLKKWFNKFLHKHNFKYRWDLSLNRFYYYYRCECGASVKSGLPPSMFTLSRHKTVLSLYDDKYMYEEYKVEGGRYE